MTDRCQYDTVCREEFQCIREKLDRIDVSIRGDGNKEPGLVTRIDRIERQADELSRLKWLVLGAVVAAVVSTIAAWIKV